MSVTLPCGSSVSFGRQMTWTKSNGVWVGRCGCGFGRLAASGESFALDLLAERREVSP